MRTEQTMTVFENLPMSGRLARTLDQIHELMNEANLTLCFVREDGRIYWIPQKRASPS